MEVKRWQYWVHDRTNVYITVWVMSSGAFWILRICSSKKSFNGNSANFTHEGQFMGSAACMQANTKVPSVVMWSYVQFGISPIPDTKGQDISIFLCLLMWGMEFLIRKHLPFPDTYCPVSGIFFSSPGKTTISEMSSWALQNYDWNFLTFDQQEESETAFSHQGWKFPAHHPWTERTYPGEHLNPD